MSIHLKRTLWLLAILGTILITIISCAFPPSLTPTETPTASTSSGGGTTGGSSTGGSTSGGNNGGSSGGSNNNQPAPASTAEPTASPTPPPTPPPQGGPYIVKQTETLGGETISGFACKVSDPFVVNFVTPKITFNNAYVPQDASHGQWAYAYSFPSLGETHDAKGTYTISPVGSDGTLQLTETGSDHVVFKGFDGQIPVNYTFNLVPSSGVPCP